MIQDKRLEKKERVIAYLGNEPYFRHAAWAIGVHEDTLANWRKEDEDFSERCDMARAEKFSKLVNRASPEFILTHADPETFNTAHKVDITSGGKPIPIMGGSSHVSGNDSLQENKQIN
jgi:hypothetical protein